MPEPVPVPAERSSPSPGGALVTVVIPALDAAADLAANLPALRAEAPDAEVIVVDDGSSDDTGAVARRLGASVLQQENRGPAAARNRGAQEASHPVLVFLDADCRVTPGWLHALVSPLRDRDVVAVKGAYLTEQASAVARLCQVEFEERYAMLERAPHVDFVDSFSMAVRRDAFLAAGGFDESFRRADNEDVDLSFRLDALGHRLVFAPAARVFHRHPDSFARYARLKFSRGYYRARVYERYPGKAARDSYTPASLKLQVTGAALLPLSIAFAPLPALAGHGSGTLALLAGSAAVAGAMVVSGLPFLARATRAGVPAAGAAAFLVVRAASIASGVVARLMRLPGPRPKVRGPMNPPA